MRIFLKVSISASTSVGWVHASIAVLGSLSRCPVTTQVIVSPLSMTPWPTSFLRPAIEAAEAGSTPIPSVLASNFWASRISSSVTVSE